jgi:vacuolar-type H+-ATPase subunit E/Vma4
MKTIKITLLLFLCTFVAQAQETYKHSLSGIKKIKVYTDTSIDLKVGTSNQFIISGANRNKQNKVRNDKAKGLKALYSRGNDNTGRGLEIIKEGNTLIVKDLESFMKRNGFKIQIPKGIEVYLNCGNLGHAKVSGITSEIEIKTNVGHINLIDISGPVTVSTNTGNITARFTTVNQSSPISLRTATGDVDVSLASNTKANLSLKTTMGTVFTDFEFKVPSSKGLKQFGNSRKINSKLNNGGVKISLNSTTGNVYLRKK